MNLLTGAECVKFITLRYPAVKLRSSSYSSQYDLRIRIVVNKWKVIVNSKSNLDFSGFLCLFDFSVYFKISSRKTFAPSAGGPLPGPQGVTMDGGPLPGPQGVRRDMYVIIVKAIGYVQ